MPCWATPMMMPPTTLMKVMSSAAMASPRTNFEAPSMAPKKDDSSSSALRRALAAVSSIRPAERSASIAICLPGRTRFSAQAIASSCFSRFRKSACGDRCGDSVRGCFHLEHVVVLETVGILRRGSDVLMPQHPLDDGGCRSPAGPASQPCDGYHGSDSRRAPRRASTHALGFHSPVGDRATLALADVAAPQDGRRR